MLGFHSVRIEKSGQRDRFYSGGIDSACLTSFNATAVFASGEASATSEWPKAVSDVGSTSDTGQQHKMGVEEGWSISLMAFPSGRKVIDPPKTSEHPA